MAYMDLHWRTITDMAFRRQLEMLSQEIELYERRAKSDPSCLVTAREKVMELLRLCNYNPALFVPHFFPQYVKLNKPPFEGPLSLAARPFSFAMFNFQVGGFTVIRASRQIGKSTTLGARQLMNAHMLPGYRSLYVVPHPEHQKTYANRLREMERAFAYPATSPHHRLNLNYKEYPNGSIIELIRVLTTAAESRGKTTDELLYDEYQHFDISLEDEVRQTQRASPMPSTIYSGTSLTVDTPLETRWEQSSQGTWHIKCPDGKHWINCGDKDDVLKIIHPKGPTCPYTGKILDVTNGQFVHADTNLLNAGKVGLHIPQLIIPDFVNDLIEWNKLWVNFTEYGINKFLQEVLGIPTMEGAREITLEDLKRMCCLPEQRNTLQQRARDGYYKFIVSGCDWGGSDYNPAEKTKISFTAHVIIGITADRQVDIIHMRKFAGMGYREVANDIIEAHRNVCGNAIATDFGVGAAYNMLLRESAYIVPERHLIFAYTGPRTAPISEPAGHGWFNQYSLNRTESITQLYAAMKGDKPRIRCYNWEDAQYHLMDFLNLYRVQTENANSGSTEFKYRRHGAKPDDCLHALNFAYTLARLMLGEPLVEDRGLMNRLMERLSLQSSFESIITNVPRVVSG